MAEEHAVRDALRELLRIEFEDFGRQMKDDLREVIREEAQGKDAFHARRRSSRHSVSRYSVSRQSAANKLTKQGSVMQQVKMLQTASISSFAYSLQSEGTRPSAGSRVAGASEGAMLNELDYVLHEQSLPFLSSATGKDAEAEEASDLHLLPYMRAVRPAVENSDRFRMEGRPDGERAQPLRAALNPTSASASSLRPALPARSQGQVPWRQHVVGHKDSYRQLELVPERVDSSHQSLVVALEEEMSVEEVASTPRDWKRAASRSMRLKSKSWQSEGRSSVWATKHRRGHEFQDNKRTNFFKSGYRTTWKLMSDFVNGSLWTRVTGAMVFLNAIMIGVQADYMAVNWTQGVPTVFHFLEKMFCVFFVLELTLRACVLGLAEFFCKPGHWHYNLFDLVMVTLQVTETMHTSPPFFDIGMTHLSTFRMLRLMRIIRLARILHLVSELRMLIVSISHSVRNLGWVVILLFLMIYVLAVYLTEIVTDYKVLHKDSLQHVESEHYKDLLSFYGSVDRSMLSLYAMVSEGTHWRELSDPLAEHISPWMPLLFSVFSAFALLAVMNVVTGVFVESAIHTAVEDKKVTIASQLGDLFKQFDEDSDGIITWEEFQSQLNSNEMQTCLKEVDVDPEDAEELFRLLDIDRSGTIDVEELVHGSMRLMGYAKAIDLATFMHEYRLNSMRWAAHARCVEGCLVALLSDVEAPPDDPDGFRASIASEMAFGLDDSEPTSPELSPRP